MNFSAENITQNNSSYSMEVGRFVKPMIVVMLCITINYINGTLVCIFFRHEVFKQNPRYILFIHLVINDMIQLILAALLYTISYTLFKINFSICCFFLIFAIITTFNTPLNLAGMSIERYIAICNPLHHTQICTVRRIYIFISVIWALGATFILPDLFVLLVTESSEFFRASIYCGRDVFYHDFMKQKRNIFHAICLCMVWLILVFSYFKIMIAAKAVSTDAKKARNTILLHAAQLLMCMLSYIEPPLKEFLVNLSPSHSRDVDYFRYLIIYIFPRCLSPILYGLRDQSFQKYFKIYVLCNMKVTCHYKQASVFKCITSPRIRPWL